MKPHILDQSDFWRVTKSPRTDKNGKNGAMILRVQGRIGGKWRTMGVVDCYTDHVRNNPELSINVSVRPDCYPVAPIKQLGMMDEAPEYITGHGPENPNLDPPDDDGTIGTAVYLK